jgi:Rod binding domain-containing protein
MTNSAINLAAGTSTLTQHDRLTQQAQKWVSQTFFGTLLKQMHESPFKSELFSGGHGGEAFQPLMDQHLADRMARASGKKLVGSIVRHIERTAAVSTPVAPANAAAEGRGTSDHSDSRRRSPEQRPPHSAVKPPHPNPFPRSTGGEGMKRNHVAPSLGNNLRA